MSGNALVARGHLKPASRAVYAVKWGLRRVEVEGSGLRVWAFRVRG